MSEKTNRILLIDDDPRNIFALSAVLRSKGYTVLTCTSALEGIELMKSEKGIKVVLLDMMLPDMDGYQALRTIKQDTSLASIPVFAVTAQAMIGDKERCLEAGADEYISKPVDVDILMGLLKVYKAVS